jgi:hypothetical protein
MIKLLGILAKVLINLENFWRFGASCSIVAGVGLDDHTHGRRTADILRPFAGFG